ncbi:MAG: hypothetical protein ACE5D7_05575 [Fidelibacterota bacterium]
MVSRIFQYHQLRRKTASNVYGILVQPDESFQLMSFDETIILSGDEEVFYHPTFVWTYPVPSNNWNNIPNAEFIYTPIAVGPYLVPYKNEIHLKFLKTSEMPSNSGIFYFDADDTKWIYMDTVNDNQFFETTILSGGVFAVISEAIPPIINNVYPKMDSVINSDEMVSITFNILDEFSGIDGERNVSVILDDKSLIFEYNSYNKKVRYDIWNHLSEGKHQIQIEAKDNLGNKTNSTHTFTVR